jgi:hypothetical protein
MPRDVNAVTKSNHKNTRSGKKIVVGQLNQNNQVKDRKDDQEEKNRVMWPAQDHKLQASTRQQAQAMPAESAMAQRSSAQV